MARVEEYPACVEEVIRRHGQYRPTYGDVEVQMVFDREGHHYQLLNVGWDRQRRIWGCLLHIDIKDGKIWIERDGTQEGVANELVEMGVSKQDIVLAFHAPYKRPYTGFAEN